MSAKTTDAPPRALPVNVEGIEDELAALPQWVGWKWEFVDDRWTKIPYNPKTGRRASSTDRTTWTSLDAAIAFAERKNLPGIGFVVTPRDPYVGIDLDKCRDPETGKVEAWALEIVALFGSLTEITPTGTGLRIWIKTHDGLLPGAEYGRRSGPVEVYGASRFFTVTGHRLERAER